MDTASDIKALKGLKIVHLNCRSIYNKIEEIRYLFKGIDILMCFETWLSEGMSDHLVSIEGMDLYRWDRYNCIPNGVHKTRGGGIACYINKELRLDCQIVKDHTKTTCDIEMLTLKCVHSFGKIRHICCVYRQPSGNIESFFNALYCVVGDNQISNHEYWISGDLNIDFLKRDDVNTKELIDFLRINGLKQFINTPAHLTVFSTSCIDHIISNNSINMVVSYGTLTDVISDHYPIFISIKKLHNVSTYNKIRGRTYHNYDKKNFQTFIRTDEWTAFYDILDPTDRWSYIYEIIWKHLDIMRPIKFIKSYK